MNRSTADKGPSAQFRRERWEPAEKRHLSDDTLPCSPPDSVLGVTLTCLGVTEDSNRATRSGYESWRNTGAGKDR